MAELWPFVKKWQKSFDLDTSFSVPVLSAAFANGSYHFSRNFIVSNIMLKSFL